MQWQFDSAPWFQFYVDALAVATVAGWVSKGFDSPWYPSSTLGCAWWQEYIPNGNSRMGDAKS